VRSKLALAGLVAGLATAVLPMVPASANCAEAIFPDGTTGCGNPCNDEAAIFNGAQEKATGKVVVNYWSLFACTQ
jgi:hypothetical protein